MSIIGFILFLAVSGCVSSDAVEPGPVSGEVDEGTVSSGEVAEAVIELRLDQPATYADLDLEWLDLEDSRCPIGVECFWAGQLVMTLKVSHAGEEPVEVELVLRVGREPQRASAYGYELWLRGVDPHPKNGVSIERSDYVAQVEIKEIQP